MRKRTLLISLAIAVLVLGLSRTHSVSAEPSNTEPGTVSSDKTQPAASSVTPAPVGTDSDSELKRGRIGGGGGRPAMRPAARPMARPAHHVGRPAGHTPPHGRTLPHGGHIAHHPGHHHPGHHPGHHHHHPGHHHHHHHPVGVVSWQEFGGVGGPSFGGIGTTGYIEPTYIETETEYVEPEETEVETEEVEQETETESLVKCCIEEKCRSMTESECELAGGQVVNHCRDCRPTN